MNRQRQQGLTLIEVLVSLAIFAIVSVAVLAMFPTIFKLNSQTRADQAVTISAKQFMENVRVNYSTKAGFDAGTMPPKPSDCSTPTVTDQLSATSGMATMVVVKRVSLTCTPTNQPTQTFVLDLGRPES